MGRMFNVLHAIASKACIESGASGGWTWRKYADGTYEAWCKTTLTYGVNAPSSSGQWGFSGGHTLTVPAAIGNTGITYASFFCPTSEGIIGKLNTVSGNDIGFGLVSPIARASAAREHEFYIKGTWE